MGKKSKISPDKRREILTIEKPDRFTDAEWARLTPREKVLYSTNKGLWKKGETSAKRGKREPKLKDLSLTVSTGAGGMAPLSPSDQGDTAVPTVRGGGEVQTAAPAFEVMESDDLAEVARVNSARMLVDAFKRAARAPLNVDAFDKHIYLALVQKLPAFKIPEEGREETPAERKTNVRILKELLAQARVTDGEYREVKGEQG